MSDERMEKLFSNLKDFINEKFNQINERFDKHEEQQKIDLENLKKRIDKRFIEHENQQEIDMKNLEKRIMQKFDEYEEKQRQDFARLEHVMYDRTAALFDAREISLEKDNNLYLKLKSLEHVLDKHHYRISELESKFN